MSSFQCPFCQAFTAKAHATFSNHYINFSEASRSSSQMSSPIILLTFAKCQHCGKTSIYLDGFSKDLEELSISVYPRSTAKSFPEYVPNAVRQDYEEACSIVFLSPKASATLSRRCLQGIIRDFWKISKNTLYDEINELQGKIPPDQWKVIDGVRRIGNIGAHMQQDIDLIIDIDPNEAQKLILLIEHLIRDWYIVRHEQRQLYQDIINIDAEKQNQRIDK